MFDQRIALIAIIALSAWLLIGLPFIYLLSARIDELAAAAPKIAPIVIAAQVFLLWGVVFHLMPAIRLDLLAMARAIAEYDLPGRLGMLF